MLPRPLRIVLSARLSRIFAVVVVKCTIEPLRNLSDKESIVISTKDWHRPTGTASPEVNSARTSGNLQYGCRNAIFSRVVLAIKVRTSPNQGTGLTAMFTTESPDAPKPGGI